MSIVDTWDFNKIDTSMYDDDIEMDTDMRLYIGLREFEENYGVCPNRIIMGINLVNELRSILCLVKSFEDMESELNKGIKYEYEGIPVNVDYVNRNNLEIGYMLKL